MGKSYTKQLHEKKNIKRSSLTGRIINGRDVILCEEAEDFLKKHGYKIIRPQMIACIMTFTNIFLLLGGFILWT